MLEIVNRTEKTVHGSAEYIGRPSALGNPFKVGRYTRDEAVEMYRQGCVRNLSRIPLPTFQALLEA